MKHAFALREEEVERAVAVEAAFAAAAEFEGQEGTWADRTAKTLKARESEWKATALASNL